MANLTLRQTSAPHVGVDQYSVRPQNVHGKLVSRGLNISNICFGDVLSHPM